jgi:hypothetical protein
VRGFLIAGKRGGIFHCRREEEEAFQIEGKRFPSGKGEFSCWKGDEEWVSILKGRHETFT